MRKVLLKNFARSALIVLAINCASMSLPVHAGYSEDPDCAGISNAAAGGAKKATDAIDAMQKEVSSSVDQAKSCVDTLVAAGSRAIADFGGGFQIPESIRSSLAKQGCKVIAAAQAKVAEGVASAKTKITTGVNEIVSDVVSDVPRAAQPLAGRAIVGGLAKGRAAVEGQISAPATTTAPAGVAAAPISLYQRLANIF